MTLLDYLNNFLVGYHHHIMLWYTAVAAWILIAVRRNSMKSHVYRRGARVKVAGEWYSAQNLAVDGCDCAICRVESEVERRSKVNDRQTEAFIAKLYELGIMFDIDDNATMDEEVERLIG